MHGTATKLQNSRKITIEGAVKGETNFDGSQDVTIKVTQDNIAIVEGQMTLQAGTLDNFIATSKQINFPDGFNKTNCCLLSFGTKTMRNNNGYGYGTVEKYDVTSIQNNIVPYTILLGDSNNQIKVILKNFYNEMIVDYQIVLMKK